MAKKLYVYVDLDGMDQYSLIDLVGSVYTSLKPYCLERYSFVKHYTDEQMIEYITIFILSYNELDRSFEDTLRLAKSLDNKAQGRKMLYDFAKLSMDKWLVHLNDYETKTIVSTKREYKQYKKDIAESYMATPDILKFIKQNENPYIERAVRTYLLQNPLDIPKIGLDYDGEELYKAALCNIYRSFRFTGEKLFPNQITRPLKTKKFIQSLTREQCDAVVSGHFDKANTYLYTEDEYVALYKIHVGVVKAIFDITKEDQERKQKKPE